MKTFLITGGLGFIGSNYIKNIISQNKECRIINLDKMTYAGNPENLKEIENLSNYVFIQGDICDDQIVDKIFSKYSPSIIINFAAETHVDRSIYNPREFISTDVFGVYNLLFHANKYKIELFIQISTDEVYGSIESGSFREEDNLLPSSPYSASKCGGDRLAYSYFKTYDLPVIITRASNNFGAFQYPEKLIPLFVTNAVDNLKLPVYGNGFTVRDWLYVDDHCDAINFLINKGKPGEVYNIGGNNEFSNLDITYRILDQLNKPKELITFIDDRKGHDLRYSLDCSKINQLGWTPNNSFDEALEKSIDWYKKNKLWWDPIKNGNFKKYYKSQYKI